MDGLIMKYFVLKPQGSDAYAVASREAMRAYAGVIKEANPELAGSLEKWATSEAAAAGSADWRAPRS